jgi:DNA uptake protein ComE-like DNA-binding protein
MYYVRSSEIDFKRVGLLLDEVRVRDYTRAGLNFVLAEIEKCYANGTVEELLNKGKFQIDIPYYTLVNKGGNKYELDTSDNVKVSVKAKIYDESGKVNFNLAPVSVIQKLLKVDGETARRLKSEFDRQNGGKWLYVLDDIYDKGVISDNVGIDHIYENLSTWNAGNPENPIPYLNINKASPEVLKAIFNLSDAEVEKIVSAKPINSLGDLISLIGRDPSNFNIKISGDLSDSKWVFPFTGRSNSFRVVLTGEMHKESLGSIYRKVNYSLEVGIIVFEGKARVVWSRVLKPI